MFVEDGASAEASNTATVPAALPTAGAVITRTPVGRLSKASRTASSQSVRAVLKTRAVRLPRGTDATSRSCVLDRDGGTDTATCGSAGSTSIQ